MFVVAGEGLVFERYERGCPRDIRRFSLSREIGKAIVWTRSIK